MKPAFKNVPFRHNSACIVQKWLRFKRVTIVRLAYISLIFPNRSNIIELLFSNYCLMNTTWQFHLLNWQRVGPMRVIFLSFVYTGLLVWAFLQSHKLNLTYCFKSSLLLAFCSVCLYG